MQALGLTLMAPLLALTCVSSWAARDFTPQAGTWVISDEVDGRPGRGFAIDVQGNTFFMQVFGYEKNGDATFYAASGQMEGNTVIAPLMRYQGGRSFGSEPRDAQEDKSMGDVTLSFRNGLQGTIQLPGEPAEAIERYVFVGRDAPYYQAQAGRETTQEALWLGLNAQGQVVSDWRAELQSGVDLLRLTLSKGDVRNTLDCERPAQSQSIRCVAANAELAPVVQAAEFRSLGPQVTGTLTLQADTTTPLRLQGSNIRTYLERCVPVVITGCYSEGWDSYSTYEGSYRRTPTYLPSNGTWLVQDERTGKPGRGISLDVQGDTMLMQVFGYRADGQPSFYMGFGRYASEFERSTTSSASFVLNRYAGGRSLGGAPASGQLLEEAGEVAVQLTAVGATSLTQAMLQFPGEAPKPMQRFTLDAMQTAEEKLFGEWYMPWIPMPVILDRMDGDSATNAEGSVRCQPAQGISYVQCEWKNSSNLMPFGLISDPFFVSSAAVRVRDRHGNLTGLGDVPLN